jgi:small subunit ribosomal protein S2
MVKLPTLLEMLKAGAHFGHQSSRWHPKMKNFIFGTRNGVHIIDLEKTVQELKKSLDYVKNLAANGKVILFVGTKHQAREFIKIAAMSCGMPYITERWIGGLLTNFPEVKRRLKKYRELKEQVATGEIEKYVKKEQVALKKRLEKMERYLSGLGDLNEMPDALYIAGLHSEKTAAAETQRMEVPVVAVCDTNINPLKVAYAIPANDDAVNSIKMIANLIAEAVNEGKVEWEKKKLAQTKEIEQKKAIVVPKKEYRALQKEEA